MKQTVTYTLEVTILDGLMTEEFAGANPVVSRTVEIRANQTLNQLHRAIFEAFGRWDDCHLHEFHLGREPRDRHAKRYVLPFAVEDPYDLDEAPPAASVTKTRIGSLGLEVGSVFWYWYDFGDDWYHEIRVLASGDAEPGVSYPRVTARVGDSPPQYVNWDEEEDVQAGPTPRDWLGEALQYGAAVIDVESGMVPIETGVLVPWVRYRVSENTAALAGDLADQRAYQVTTRRCVTGQTCELTTYLISGQYLDAWLASLVKDGEVTVLSVEVLGGSG